MKLWSSFLHSTQKMAPNDQRESFWNTIRHHSTNNFFWFFWHILIFQQVKTSQDLKALNENPRQWSSGQWPPFPQGSPPLSATRRHASKIGHRTWFSESELSPPELRGKNELGNKLRWKNIQPLLKPSGYPRLVTPSFRIIHLLQTVFTFDSFDMFVACPSYSIF